jgi:hypothetical protein
LLLVQGFFVLSFLHRNADAVRAFGSLVSAAAAVAACIFVPWQIASNERSNRETAAREIYREFLNISIQRPELASQNLCAFTDPINRSAYESYVDYLLYSAEQVIALDKTDWEATVLLDLSPHLAYLCTFDAADLNDLTPEVVSLVNGLRSGCAKVPACEGAKE